MIMRIKRILRSIFTIIRIRLHGERKPLRVIIGAGTISIEGWISTDIDLLDVRSERRWRALFNRRRISHILAEHVFEHMTMDEMRMALRHAEKYLVSGGIFRIAVPDGFHPGIEYIQSVMPGGCGPGATDHKVLYDYKSIQGLFDLTNYTVRLLEYFDENGVFHSNEWDIADGFIERSIRFDERNRTGKPVYTSLILDAIRTE